MPLDMPKKTLCHEAGMLCTAEALQLQSNHAYIIDSTLEHRHVRVRPQCGSPDKHGRKDTRADLGGGVVGGPYRGRYNASQSVRSGEYGPFLPSFLPSPMASVGWIWMAAARCVPVEPKSDATRKRYTHMAWQSEKK